MIPGAIRRSYIPKATVGSMAPRKNSGPIQRRAVQVLRDRGIISTTEWGALGVATGYGSFGYSVFDCVRAVWLSQSPLVPKFPLKNCDEGKLFLTEAGVA